MGSQGRRKEAVPLVQTCPLKCIIAINVLTLTVLKYIHIFPASLCVTNKLVNIDIEETNLLPGIFEFIATILSWDDCSFKWTLWQNLRGGRPLQRLPSLRTVQQRHGDQRHPAGLVVHRLPSHPWVHLYQEGQRDPQVRDYPEDRIRQSITINPVCCCSCLVFAHTAHLKSADLFCTMCCTSPLKCIQQ